LVVFHSATLVCQEGKRKLFMLYQRWGMAPRFR